MSNITKEQWEGLEKTMAGSWVDVTMRYQGYELHITRVRTSESQTPLAVYINNAYNPAWGYPDELLPENTSRDRPSIIADVWRKRTKAKYKVKHIKDVEHIYGKLRAKKAYPDLYEHWEFFDPVFPKASVLCRQLKKLEGLELIDGGDYVQS